MLQIVAADEALANEAAAASQAIRDDCESDLSEAEPALISATNALNTLKSSDITVIKAMKNPPSVVKLVRWKIFSRMETFIYTDNFMRVKLYKYVLGCLFHSFRYWKRFVL